MTQDLNAPENLAHLKNHLANVLPQEPDRRVPSRADLLLNDPSISEIMVNGAQEGLKNAEPRYPGRG